MNIKILFIDEKVIENVHFGHFLWLSIPNRAFKQARLRIGDGRFFSTEL